MLAAVGPRLRWVRNQRDVTLTELAAATGISKSTLSRLESGQRKPSLELLLPIAQAHRIPLDELVGSPDIGDPRIRLKPEKRSGGRIVVPLTRQPRGVHAWKVVIPPERGEPKLRTHEGYEWLYVLAGELRLLLGGHDVDDGAGRGRGVRHAGAALVRPGRGATRRDPQHPQSRRGTDTRPGLTAAQGGRELVASMDAAGIPLLESKLRAPRRRTGVVRRDRLAQRIDREGLPSLALVSAPAGFGKTTLVTEWLAEGPAAARVAWLSLDRGDSDPSVYWAYVVAALRKVDPDIGDAGTRDAPRHAEHPR